ncbi:hypothetical protein [Paraliobacillus ryukyuensis]|uniref:hypothetical protein n=1 Tax=Paraliobacillus ryukyuensis TaxID=200904 RepID=UPI0009A59B0C|nr:hypothetical protein [Paraliobacillus ryukyuensis]
MNNSEQRLLNRLLEKVRKVYGQTNFINAYDIATDSHSAFLNIKDMVNNKKFNDIAEKEINKAYRYAHSLSY